MLSRQAHSGEFANFIVRPFTSSTSYVVDRA